MYTHFIELSFIKRSQYGDTFHHKVLRAYCFLSDLYLTDTSSDYYPTEKNKTAFKPKSVAPRV